MKHSTKHCCDLMQLNIDDGRVQIFYSPIKRRYYINVVDQKKVTATQGLVYCPWCAQRLPSDLRKAYQEILRTEYGLEPRYADPEQIPQEFRTDAWWKKRGL